jgi:hypothetical protein
VLGLALVGVLRGDRGLGHGPGHRRLARAFWNPTLLDAVPLGALGSLLLLAGALTLELPERGALTSATCHERLQSIEVGERCCDDGDDGDERAPARNRCPLKVL